MARDIDTVGVVGLGTMGAGIAEVFAKHGLAVIGVERDGEALTIGRGHLERSTERAVRRGRMADDERTALIDRIEFTTELERLAPCDLIIEAVPEHLPIKAELFGALDRLSRPEAVLTTNTSSLSIADIASATVRPTRVLGMHFFNPAPVLKLVEVVRTPVTDEAAVAAVSDLARRLGKTPVVCGDQAGFIANALLIGYLNHAAHLVGDGYATVTAIDDAVRLDLGYPMGPLSLLDLIGLDTVVQILQRMHDETGRDRHATASVLTRLVGEGNLGRKSGQGFYRYGDGDPQAVVGETDEESAAAPGEIAETLLRPYLDDAVRMRDDGYAGEADVDIAMKLGCGLPKGPFEMLAERPADLAGRSER